jgi:hypothetical protein
MPDSTYPFLIVLHVVGRCKSKRQTPYQKDFYPRTPPIERIETKLDMEMQLGISSRVVGNPLEYIINNRNFVAILSKRRNLGACGLTAAVLNFRCWATQNTIRKRIIEMGVVETLRFTVESLNILSIVSRSRVFIRHLGFLVSDDVFSV